MKRKVLIFSVMVLAVVFAFLGCEDDDGSDFTGVNDTNPQIQNIDGNDIYVIENYSAKVGDTIEVGFDGDSGTNLNIVLCKSSAPGGNDQAEWQKPKPSYQFKVTASGVGCNALKFSAPNEAPLTNYTITSVKITR